MKWEGLDKGRYWQFGWKVVEGCTPCSPGCENCWSLAMEHRFGKSTEVQCFESRLDKPLKRKKPTVYAIWNDLFHKDVPFKFVDKVFAVIALCPQHTFLVLTKRTDRMKEYICEHNDNLRDTDIPFINELFDNSDFIYETARVYGGKPEPYCDMIGVSSQLASSRMCIEPDTYPELPLPNLWLGVTVCNQEEKNKIDLLRETPAAHRFLSLEPLLEDLGELNLEGIDQIILGGETGKNARPMHPDWARSIRDQCKEAGVPFFIKQMTGRKPIPEDLQINDLAWRQ